MSVHELQKIATVDRADAGSHFNYAEHLEEDAEVYIAVTEENERVEYHFFNGRVYKIFVVYDRMPYHTDFYDSTLRKVNRGVASRIRGRHRSPTTNRFSG